MIALKHWVQTIVVGSALLALTAPAGAQARWTGPTDQNQNAPATTMSSGSTGGPEYWHVNMAGGFGKLLSISPVAARIQLQDGTTNTFSISHAQYEKLKSMVGLSIGFEVRHDVLYSSNT